MPPLTQEYINILKSKLKYEKDARDRFTQTIKPLHIETIENAEKEYETVRATQYYRWSTESLTCKNINKLKKDCERLILNAEQKRDSILVETKLKLQKEEDQNEKRKLKIQRLEDRIDSCEERLAIRQLNTLSPALQEEEASDPE